MFRELLGAWRRLYNQLRLPYRYTGEESQPNAELFPYQRVGTGFSWRELNRKRKEVGDLWDSNVSAELRELGDKFNKGEISYEDLVGSTLFKDQLEKEQVWAHYPGPTAASLDLEERVKAMVEKVGPTISPLIGPTFGSPEDGALPRLSRIAGEHDNS